MWEWVNYKDTNKCSEFRSKLECESEWIIKTWTNVLSLERKLECERDWIIKTRTNAMSLEWELECESEWIIKTRIKCSEFRIKIRMWAGGES